MIFQNFLQNILSDLRIELTDEFDRNFERKAFFDQPWPSTKYPNNRGSTMMRTGDLRAGYRSDISGTSLNFTNTQPYASIHNEGGELTVSVNMKKYFWAMFFKAGGKKAGLQAQYWKSLALMKTGSKIKIPKRQVIGQHAQVDIAIRHVVDTNVQNFANEIANALKR